MVQILLHCHRFTTPLKKNPGMGFNGVVNLRHWCKMCNNDVDLVLIFGRFWKLGHISKLCCKSICWTLAQKPFFRKRRVNSGKKGLNFLGLLWPSVPHAGECSSCGRNEDLPREIFRDWWKFCWSDDATCRLIQVNILYLLRVGGPSHPLQLFWKRCGGGEMPLFCCCFRPQRLEKMY